MSRSSSSLSARSSSPSLASRSTTSHRSTKSNLPVSPVKPSEIYDLKLLTQQYQQQSRVLRTQLNRTNLAIHAKTTVINRTFEQSGNRPMVSKTIHDTTIHNLKRSIQGGQNTLLTLREDIDRLERDDHSSMVEELEEDLKMTYCESARLAMLLQERRGDRDFYLAEQERKLYRSSNEHITEMRAEINAVRDQNAILRSKARSYQLKLEKFRIEDEVAEKIANNVSPGAVVEQSEVESTAKQQMLDTLTYSLSQEMDEYRQSVLELNGLIDDMKARIREHLDEEEKAAAAAEHEK
jgi:hypothetical protein